MQTKFRSWVQSPRVRYAAIVLCFIYGIAIGTGMHHMGQLDRMVNENGISFNINVISFVLFVILFPASVLLFKAFLFLEFRLSEMIFESDLNQKYNEIKTARMILGMRLYFKALIYSGIGMLVSALWTSWSIAFFGGLALSAGIESLFVLRYVFKPVPVAEQKEESEEA